MLHFEKMTKDKQCIMKTIIVMAYLVAKQYGYLDELKQLPNFTDELIGEFCSLSFIKTGYTENKRTWGVTQFGCQYYEIVR